MFQMAPRSAMLAVLTGDEYLRLLETLLGETRRVLPLLSSCALLREGHRWRAELVRLDDEWWDWEISQYFTPTWVELGLRPDYCSPGTPEQLSFEHVPRTPPTTPPAPIGPCTPPGSHSDDDPEQAAQ